MKENIDYQTFEKLDLRVGTITQAELVPDSKKLLQLTVDFGSEQRQVVAGIAKAYEPASLINVQAVFLLNLEPRTLAGLESQAMLLAAGGAEALPVILRPDKELPPGTQIH
jgi:methionyl-tRNA synthetase